MKTILVTGGAGFIGSNFIGMMLERHPTYRLVNVDALTYAGNLENLQDVMDHPRHVFVKGDIRNREQMETVFADYDIDLVVNFAAESHVDRSIDQPEAFLTTNVVGTQILLDLAKNHWKVNPDDQHCRQFRQGVRFLQVSTDEVYGSLGETGSFTETMPLMPNSPYAASKASADLIVRAYDKTYGLPVNITRCSNNYGPFQFPEKLIPLMISSCLKGEALPVYGDGLQIRDWLHVADHCAAIDLVLHEGKAGQVYNIGGSNEKRNIDMVKLILSVLGKSEDLITRVKDRPGHDRRYAIDSSKIQSQLGWQPQIAFEDGMRDTIKWYVNHQEWLEHIASGEYENSYKTMIDDLES